MMYNTTKLNNEQVMKTTSIQRAAARRSALLLAITLFATSLVLPIAGCTGDAKAPASDHHAEGSAEAGHDHEGTEHEGEEHEEGELELTPAAMKESGIAVEEVRGGPVSSVVRAPGRVVPTQNGIAHVGSVVAGRVTRLHVSEGARVGRGAVMAEIEAFDIGAIKGEYLHAKAEAEERSAALQRQERLGAEGIGARRSLEEARSGSQQAAAALRSAEAKLAALGISPSSLGSGAFSSRILLRSPIAGVVARRGVVLGEYVEPSRDLFEVINHATVWVDAQLAPAVALGLNVGGVGFVAAGGERRSGRIIFVSPSVDPESRTITVRIEVENGDLALRPEAFVNVEFERGVSGSALAIPREAIEKEAEHYFVYREHEAGTFERVEIEPGEETSDRTVVRAGLKEGDRIAVSGIFYLRSIRQKEELQEHEH
jgi:cobalt-zinc-cadmium efflux system membrane fusion protein